MPSGPRDEPGGDDPVLVAERDHLRSSREFLRLMRENVLSLRALGADRVSEEYLKADLHRRAEALIDLPDTPLFFGLLDYAVWPDDAGEAGPGAEFHIGRRHVHDPDGQPAVIDWRAPVSRPFYRASPADPMGVALRRRFGFAGGELTAYEDEDFTAADQTVCVQGAPGTGKTAVGLHRVAYLLYAYAERMRRGGVLVVGPNRAFLAYIRNVLPALGELDVTQLSVTDLLATVPVREADPEDAARIKGDVRMAEVLRRALWLQLAEPAEALMVSRGSRRWRVSAYELSQLVEELRERGVRYGTGREMLAHRIAHVVLTRMEAGGEPCDDRTHDAVRRTGQVRAAVNAIWPKADPVRLVFGLLSDPALLSKAAGDLLDPGEQAAIGWARPARGPGSARWSPADAVLIDEARDLIERTPSLAHVVVDEAQDLSPMECRALGRRCATGSATVLGDIAQGTTPWATASWQQMLTHLGKQDAGLRILDTGYRVPRQILDFASRLLDLIAPGLDPATSVRQDPGSLVITPATPEGFPGALAGACADALTRPGSAAVIAADDQVAGLSVLLDQANLAHVVLDGDSNGQPLTVVPVTLAKGLEFDQVIVVEPARIAASEARGLHRLYVALTRAVSRLTIIHTDPLPEPLT